LNLNKLFEAQRKLDERIVKEKGLENEDLLDKKILALQVELGELANNWRGFKFWSENQEPRTYGFDDDKDCEYCNGTGTVREHPSDTGYSCPDCEGSGFMYYNPLLEEYVDVLHFILSIGNDLGISKFDEYRIIQPESNITDCFLSIFECVSSLDITKDSHDFSYLFRRFKELGRSLGFTWEQIEQAYFEKNKVNHKRQESGY